MAIGTSHRPHIAFELTTLRNAIRVAVLVQQVRHDPFKLAAVLHRRLAAAPRIGNVQLAGAPHPQLLELWIKFIPGGLEHGARFEFMHALDRFGHTAIDMPPPAPQILPPADQLEAPLLKVQGRVGYQQLGVERVEFAQAIALVAHALRAVKAEQLRRRWFETESAIGAGIIDREDRIVGPCLGPTLGFAIRGLAVLNLDEHRTLANRQSQFDRFGQSRSDVCFDLQPVDNDFNVVPHLAIESQVVVQGNRLAIDSRADEPLLE